jgi:hypothetical protein
MKSPMRAPRGLALGSVCGTTHAGPRRRITCLRSPSRHVAKTTGPAPRTRTTTTPAMGHCVVECTEASSGRRADQLMSVTARRVYHSVYQTGRTNQTNAGSSHVFARSRVSLVSSASFRCRCRKASGGSSHSARIPSFRRADRTRVYQPRPQLHALRAPDDRRQGAGAIGSPRHECRRRHDRGQAPA